MRNIARCATGHDRPESAVTIAGIRNLTYDIRELVPDLLQGGTPIPVSASQEKKITSAVRARLPEWIAGSVKPVLEGSLCWLQYGDHDVAPIRRSLGGTNMPITKWIQYADP